jgi:hypothetical protein
MLLGDVYLLEFVTGYHDKPDDHSIDDGDCRVANPLRSPPLKGVGRPRRYQFLRDPTEVAITPAGAPDLRYVRRIVRRPGTKNHKLLTHNGLLSFGRND